MDLLERVEQLRDEYRRRQQTAEIMLKGLESDYNLDIDREAAMKRIKTKASLYREFADEIDRIL